MNLNKSHSIVSLDYNKKVEYGRKFDIRVKNEGTKGRKNTSLFEGDHFNAMGKWDEVSFLEIYFNLK